MKDRISQESATVDGLQRALSEKGLQLKQTVQSLNEVGVRSIAFYLFVVSIGREITVSIIVRDL